MMDSDSISQPVLRDRKNHTITCNVANSNSPGQNSDADGVGANSNDVALMAKLQAQVRAFISPSVYSMLSNLRRKMALAFGLDYAPASTVGMTFGACCSNVVFLEQLVRLEPGCTTLVTFAQFAFIAVEKFFSETRCFRKKRAVPLSRYIEMVAVFFTQSFLNNYVFNFDIPMPLHMIFKSASLLSNMALGIVILNRSYSFRKYSAVSLLTVGIIVCTMASAAPREQMADTRSSHLTFSLTQIIGIAILILALLLSSMMGILQEKVTADFGKHPGEMMFYIHALALPVFVMFTPQMWHSFKILAATPSSWITLGLPTGIGSLLANILTQHLCITSVCKLSTECTSLTVTLVLTLRKFVSLVISIFYFGNEFSFQHWIGTALVFIGTLLFLDAPPSSGQKDAKDKQAKVLLSKVEKQKSRDKLN